MRTWVILMALALAACAQLQRGEMQPVKPLDAKQQTYFTTCSGTVEDWGSCNRKARATCANGYDIVNRDESTTGARREMTFRCR